MSIQESSMAYLKSKFVVSTRPCQKAVEELPQKYLILTSLRSFPNNLQFFSQASRIRGEMAVPEVNMRLLGELQEMGFPLAQATRALHFSGNSSIIDAINWLVDHENDPDINQMPLVLPPLLCQGCTHTPRSGRETVKMAGNLKVPVDIDIQTSDPSQITEEVKLKAEELRDQRHNKKEKEEKKLEREREKERRRAGKELLEARRVQEENERKRFLALWKEEREQKKRERDIIRQKLWQDKAERRQGLGVPAEVLPPIEEASVLMHEKNGSQPSKSAILPVSATKADLMRDCLKFLKRNNMADEIKVRRAFQTLLIYVRNVAKNPDEEKFRKIPFSNPAFQDRVGNMKEGIQFLELCGFEIAEGGKFLFLPKDKVDMEALKIAGTLLNSAITNPFFGLLSR
ncbi:uncharacterized protein LOC127813874 isoform X1 [Diospyros lotus]|uniref:uncharacterized protein LOC127813874 isoform X1 n=1 Tax=Diospyros lotus TaxID=55363 RepID=UPI002251CEE3|nr:uncharacterized protein LOC127813874 isoform X1 [Diospyros lotus]